MQNQFYVYVCYINDVPAYVGKGKDKRYRHCTSGKSHNQKLNEALSKYGIKSFKVQVEYKNTTQQKAFQLERKLIEYFLLQGYELFNNDAETLWFLAHEIPCRIFYDEPIPAWVTEEIE